MSYPIKIGRKPNIITVQSTDAHREMFTTDIERIKQFIAVSDYLSNPIQISGKHFMMPF